MSGIETTRGIMETTYQIFAEPTMWHVISAPLIGFLFILWEMTGLVKVGRWILWGRRGASRRFWEECKVQHGISAPLDLSPHWHPDEACHFSPLQCDLTVTSSLFSLMSAAVMWTMLVFCIYSSYVFTRGGRFKNDLGFGSPCFWCVDREQRRQVDVGESAHHDGGQVCTQMAAGTGKIGVLTVHSHSN